MSTLGSKEPGEPTIRAWPDKDVLAEADLRMSVQDDQRFSELLFRQQAGLLSTPERSELLSLMAAYQDGMVRKARALAEAVRRGLRGPLSP